MILAHFRVGRLGGETHLVHSPKNPAMHRFQAVADIRQGAAHDHAHGVIEIRPPHLVFDIDGNQVFPPSPAGGAARPGRWRGWTLGRVFLIWQNGSLKEVKPYYTKELEKIQVGSKTPSNFGSSAKRESARWSGFGL